MNLDDILQQLILVDGNYYTKKQLYNEVVHAVNEHTIPRRRQLRDDDSDDVIIQRKGRLRGGCDGCVAWFNCCCCIPIFCLKNGWTRWLLKVIGFLCAVLCFVAFMVFLSRKAVF